MRRRIIAGNWKMNKTVTEAVALSNNFKKKFFPLPLVKNEEVDVVFCVPAIDIVPVVETVKGSNVKVGAENLYFKESGAYTGEISPLMLKDAGVEYVIIGHSERREYFADDILSYDISEENDDENIKELVSYIRFVCKSKLLSKMFLPIMQKKL